MTPDASPSAENFQICTLNSESQFDLLQMLIKIGIQKHQEMKAIKLLSSNLVKIHTNGIDIQIDGDFIGKSPCSISRIHDSLNVIIPKQD